MKKASEKDKEIIELAKEIIDRTEDRTTSVESIVFKAHRLAKLVDDEKVMGWLALEIYGYADKEPDRSYLNATGRTFNETTRLGNWGSISAQESMIETSLQEMEAVKSFKPSGTYASLQFTGQQQQVRNLATKISVYRNICSKVIASVHQFASRVYYARKFQQQITSILDSQREEAEKAITKTFPKLKNYFEVINKNINSVQPEDWTTAAMQCRNILIHLSGELWKVGTKEYKCKDGEILKTDGEKNKLIAYIDTKIVGSNSKRAKARRLFKTIHEIFEIGGKSKRSINKKEFATAVTQTYIFLYDLASSTDLKSVETYND